MHNCTNPTAVYSERITFENGQHITLSVEDPNYVTVRGRIAGESIDVDLRADTADDDAELLLNGNSPDALWNLPKEQASRLGRAMLGAAGAARLATPATGSPQNQDAPAAAGVQHGPAHADLFPHIGQEDACSYCGRHQTDEEAEAGRTLEHVTKDLLAIHRTNEGLKRTFGTDHPGYSSDVFDLLCDLDAAAADAEHGEQPERIALDGGRADIENPGDHVELTVTLGERVAVGLALSTTEAARIGAALTAAAARADARTLEALAVTR